MLWGAFILWSLIILIHFFFGVVFSVITGQEVLVALWIKHDLLTNLKVVSLNSLSGYISKTELSSRLCIFIMCQKMAK